MPDDIEWPQLPDRHGSLGAVDIPHGARPGGASAADRLVEAIWSLAEGGSPDAAGFAGAVHAGSGIKLYATDPQACERLLDQARSDSRDRTTAATVAKVRNSHAAIRAIQDRIMADLERLGAEGIELGSWGPGYAQNRVVVGVSSKNLATAAKVLRDRYGATMVAVEPGRKWLSA